MATHFSRQKVNIFGHKNPDTDSICAAISYCWLKQQLNPKGEYEARRCGNVNRESAFVLDYWKAPTHQREPPDEGRGYPPAAGN